MCHNSVTENKQIEKCIENGMPAKIIKTLKSTMRKRAAHEELHSKLQQIEHKQINSQQNSNNNNSSSKQEIRAQESDGFVSKCPFGHGKLTTPAATFFFSTLTPPPTAQITSQIDNEFDFSNNNNNLHEQFPQITQLDSTITSAKTATDGGNATINLSRRQLDDDDKNIYKDDILAKSTQLTRELASAMQQALRRLQSSKIYTLLTRTTQPAHLVVIATVTFVLVTIWPELIDGNNDSSSQHLANRPEHTTSVPNQDISVRKTDMLALIAYLGAFSAHFGAQIWMTFVSGLSLYFSLPRHIFGQCQQILFPKYFALNAALSIVMMILYAKCFVNTWTLAKCIQLGALSLTGAIELLVRLYLAPILLRLMHEKYKIEGSIGSGREVGSLVQGDLIKCPHYQRVHKAFRRIHMTVAIANIITMAGSCLQIYNIAGQLQISLVH